MISNNVFQLTHCYLMVSSLSPLWQLVLFCFAEREWHGFPYLLCCRCLIWHLRVLPHPPSLHRRSLWKIGRAISSWSSICCAKLPTPSELLTSPINLDSDFVSLHILFQPGSVIRPLQKTFFWSSLVAYVWVFVRACIHCPWTVRWSRVPRFSGLLLYENEANDLFQFNFTVLRPDSDSSKYSLMVRDDHSRYYWLFNFSDTVARNSKTVIMDWSTAFGVPKALISFKPTHFCYETVRIFRKDFVPRVTLRFSIARGWTVL